MKSIAPIIAPTGFAESADGSKLPWYSTGTGERQIFIFNGFTCNQHNIKYLLEGLAPGFRVVAWDYKGHGLAEGARDLTTVTIDGFLDDARRVKEAAGLDKPVLLGYSMGAQFVLEYALRYPAEVEALISLNGITGRVFDRFMNTNLMAGLIPLLRSGLPVLENIYEFLWKGAMNLPFELRFEMSKLLFLDAEMARPEDVRPFMDSLADLDVRLMLELAREIHEHNPLEELHRIQAPTLFLTGDKDNFAPSICSVEARSRIPGARLRYIPGGTHNANLEQPEFILEAIHDFLANT